jgi:hypothetical protein
LQFKRKREKKSHLEKYIHIKEEFKKSEIKRKKKRKKKIPFI